MANIKVNSSLKETLALATQLYLGKTEEEISCRVKDTLEALQRSTIAQLTGQRFLNKDRGAGVHKRQLLRRLSLLSLFVDFLSLQTNGRTRPPMAMSFSFPTDVKLY